MPIKNPSTLRKWSSAIIGMVILMVAFSTYHVVNSGAVTSSSELTEIEVTLDWIKLVEVRSSISYDLKFKEYSNEFKLAADYAYRFHYIDLIRDSVGGPEYRIAIRNSDIEDLNADKKLKLKGIRYRGKRYLSIDDVVAIDAEHKKNSPFVFVFFFLLALAIYIFRRYYYRNDI